MSPGPFGILDDRLKKEVESRVKTFQEVLVPLFNKMIDEQKRTNDILDEILKEIKYTRRKKK